MNIKEKRKLAEEFIYTEGAAQFDFKNKTIILNDGGLFSIDKEVKMVPRTRFVSVKGDLTLKKIKGKKVKREYYNAYLWFEEIHETIRYLKRLEKILIKMGYNTKWGGCNAKKD